ncbi:hypothetical protein PU629_00915 [Pullulanibacillus sp. KACC 23026]|uniref:hypothetical protein n=1 Tax=Pullulanibacillus sp. KACC 23026 TaxID=3028315 RepID=UPI0023AFE0F3|nr:hypothetical protein [Pullulanibacillus sp. KACC 23026]WEG12948.1 hypothetical protein PU629_00915 [Pullulanibacillus sp. KACC 23026]
MSRGIKDDFNGFERLLVDEFCQKLNRDLTGEERQFISWLSRKMEEDREKNVDSSG